MSFRHQLKVVLTLQKCRPSRALISIRIYLFNFQASFGYSLDSASLFRNSGGVKGGDNDDESGGRIAAIAATAIVGTFVLVACVAVFLVWRR